jgi:hypothetical protein
MPQLIISDRFRTEYDNFKTKIDAVTDDKLREQLTEWLNKLVNEIKDLDFQTNTVRPGMPLSPMASEVRTRILDLRKKITKSLEQQGF